MKLGVKSVMDEIIDLVKDDISNEKLFNLLMLLDKLDTESKRSIISYMQRGDALEELERE